MTPQDHLPRLRFESFELDLRTRELSKEGRPIKLQDKPAKLLALLASRPGELVTRAEIEKALWGDDEFVEFEHGINTAMRKIREALGDDLGKPRFIETLPRKGYRFIASVEAVPVSGAQNSFAADSRPPAQNLREKIPVRNHTSGASSLQGVGDISSSPNSLSQSRAGPGEEEFALPHRLSQGLFLMIQVGYLAIYSAALYYAESLEQTLTRVLRVPAGFALPLLIVCAMCGIAVRLYLLSSVGFGHPAAGEKFRRLFFPLFVLDTLWATSPLLLAGKIGPGLALACVAALVYLPFSQRTLVRSIYPLGMGPGQNNASGNQ
ncbi:MAG: winged helix-turn-helix transcriptional regulator [Acidobacteria bacterium]|nr:winged helix-turn-helix transcriptional regulator [Acidobacteriota bacterium]